MLYMLGAGRARAHAAAGRRADEGRGARAGARRSGLRTADEAREHGRLLHHAGRARGVPRRAHPASGRAHRRHRRARPSARTTASTAFTIGQRRGLDVAVGERRYVVDISAADATVAVGPRDALLRDRRARARPRSSHRPLPSTFLVQTRAHGAVDARRVSTATRSCSRRRSRASRRARSSRATTATSAAAEASPRRERTA